MPSAAITLSELKKLPHSYNAPLLGSMSCLVGMSNATGTVLEVFCIGYNVEHARVSKKLYIWLFVLSLGTKESNR